MRLLQKLGLGKARKTASAPPISDTFTSYSSSVSDPVALRIVEDDRSDVPADARAKLPASDFSTPEGLINRVETAVALNSDKQAKIAELLAAVTFMGTACVSDVLTALRTYGLAIFPALYDRQRLAKVEQEFHRLMSEGSELAANLSSFDDDDGHSKGHSLLRSKLAEAQYPETLALLGSPILKSICEKFFSGQSFDFNSDLLVQSTWHTSAPRSGALHWDKQLTLKSWLYVTDGEADCGPMRAAPGTAGWTRYVREDAMFQGMAYKDIVNQIPESGVGSVLTGGPAGTFFLFVTDTAHGATRVAEGNVRNIIRARSRPTRVAQWSNWATKQ